MESAEKVKITFTISDSRSMKWRGPLGTPEEKQELCVWAINTLAKSAMFHGRSDCENLYANKRLRDYIKENNNWPPIDCVKRRGYWYLSLEI